MSTVNIANIIQKENLSVLFAELRGEASACGARLKSLSFFLQKIVVEVLGDRFGHALAVSGSAPFFYRV